MSFKFLNQRIHAYLDYPVALGLIGLPFLLGLGGSGPAPIVLSVATGIAALMLTLWTDHELGVWRVIPFRVHEAVDGAVGLVFIAAPSVLGFVGPDAAYFWALGSAVLLVLALTDRRQPVATGE